MEEKTSSKEDSHKGTCLPKDLIENQKSEPFLFIAYGTGIIQELSENAATKVPLPRDSAEWEVAAALVFKSPPDDFNRYVAFNENHLESERHPCVQILVALHLLTCDHGHIVIYRMCSPDKAAVHSFIHSINIS